MMTDADRQRRRRWRDRDRRWKYPLVPEFPDAACAASDVDPAAFFDDDHPGHALAICSTCPELAACFKFAMEHPAVEGVWGGTTKNERDAARRRQRRQDR